MIEITKCPKLPPIKYPLHPKFGSIFAPHMVKLTVENGQTKFDAQIVPFERELFSPATAAFHYGQTVFEGLKVFRQADGGVAAFRADLHATRFRKSAKRLAMPDFPEEVFLECLKEYMNFEEASVPSEPDHSLYIRPILFASDEIIKVGRSKSYKFYIIASIAGSYFHGGVAKPARVMVNRQFVRAFPGGMGEVKTAANYAASLWPQTYSEKYGCDQVLYLDALKHEYIDELGGMNFFAVREGTLVTPALNGCILRGVTRRSIIELASRLDLKVKEVPLSFSELVNDIKKGLVTETFACGTAAVVHSIGSIVFQEQMDSKEEIINLPQATPVAEKVGALVKAAQRGQVAVPEGWLFR